MLQKQACSLEARANTTLASWGLERVFGLDSCASEASFARLESSNTPPSPPPPFANTMLERFHMP